MILPVCAVQINEGDGTIVISNNDNAIITGTVIDGSESGYVWVYTGNYKSLIYGEPIIVSGDTYKMTINKSVSIAEGKYKIFIQFAGKNNIQEVLFNKETSKLFSPWIYPKPLDVSNNIAAVPNQIEKYCSDNIKYCDDTFINSTLVVEGSFIKFSEQYQVQNDGVNDITKNGMLYVGGTTNIDPSNRINVTLDYIQTVPATIEARNPYGYYVWYAHLNISRLRSGDHTILIQSNKIADLKSILTISEYIPTPKPTPTPVRYVRNEMKDFVAVTNTPVVKVVVTPIVINSGNQKFVPVVTIAPTEEPQPAPSGAVFIAPTPKPTSTKSSANILVVLVGIILSLVIINKKIE